MSRSPSSTALLVLLLVFIMIVGKKTMRASALNATTTIGASPQKIERIQRYLKKINKPAVKSIKSPDGDIIDCVLINKQLSLDHPLLKNHKIQRVAPRRPASRLEAKNQQPRNKTVSKVWQAWNQIENCPNGTVSVRRATVDDVLRAESLSPLVENSGEFSLSQIWLSAGSYETLDLNTIEVGWQVFAGDSAPRLFVYWTRDAYANTGCYNLMCEGFVQISDDVVVGATIAGPLSAYNGGQFEITLLVWKDPISGDWWLSYENIDVGYWPAKIFTHLASYATSVHWGGEIVNSNVNGQHTATQMGSGHFAEEGYGKASYFDDVEVVDSDNDLSPPYTISTTAGNPNCYNIQTFFDASSEFYFFYGGPGRNPKCP